MNFIIGYITKTITPVWRIKAEYKNVHWYPTNGHTIWSVCTNERSHTQFCPWTFVRVCTRSFIEPILVVLCTPFVCAIIVEEENVLMNENKNDWHKWRMFQIVLYHISYINFECKFQFINQNPTSNITFLIVCYWDDGFSRDWPW